MSTPQSNVRQLKPSPKIKPGAEYTSGAPYLSEQPRVLPQAFDDLARELGHATFDEMLHDPDIYAGVMLICLMALGEKLLITAALKPSATEQPEESEIAKSDAPVQQPQDLAKPSPSQTIPADRVPLESNAAKPTVDPRIQLAQDIADFCERQVKRVNKFSSAVFQLVFEGFVHGNKVAEQVLEVPTRGQDAGMWCLQALKPKPRESLAFVVDAYMNELGFVVAKPGQGYAVTTSTYVNLDDIIPREKFAVFTYKPVDNNPLGTSGVRAAYNDYNINRRTYPEYLLFLMVSAIPGILATLAPEADDELVYEDDGITPVIDRATNEPVRVSASQYLLNILSKMRNHQVAVAPDGTSFTLLEANSEGEVFTKALDHFSKNKSKAILLQELATRDAAHQTKGATSSQFRVIDLLVFWIRDTLADMVKYDIFKPLVRYNYGDDAADELLPNCTYGDTESRDWAQDANAAAAIRDGLTDSQWEHVTTQLGIPPPTEAERKARQMLRELLAQRPVSDGADNKDDKEDKDNKPGDKPDAKPPAGGDKEGGDNK